VAKPSRFSHIVLQTDNIPVMRDWWCTVLEADVTFEGGPVCFISYEPDVEHHRIALGNLEGSYRPRDPEAKGMFHVGFAYESFDDLFGNYERLKARGIEPWWAINHGATTSLYYRDPDGNNAELFVDNFPSRAQAEAFRASDVFKANPIGIEFDPEEKLAEVRAGASFDELARYGPGRDGQ
jgi:catechol-2,3-dioxygenase